MNWQLVLHFLMLLTVYLSPQINGKHLKSYIWVSDVFIKPKFLQKLLLLQWFSIHVLLVNFELHNSQLKLFHSSHISLSSSVVRYIRTANHYNPLLKIRIACCTTTITLLCNSPEKSMQFPTVFLYYQENNLSMLRFPIYIQNLHAALLNHKRIIPY